MKVSFNICELIAEKLSENTEHLNKTTQLIKSCPLIHYEKKFSKGELIFGPYDTEDKIFVIREGEVEIYQLSPNGKRVIIDILIPGDIFANSPISLQSYVETNDFAQARCKVILCILQKSDFLSVLEKTPLLAVGLIGELSAKLYEADGRIRDFALSDARTRLIRELMRLGTKVGKESNGKIIIATKLTHEELADMTGVARETITRLLAELRQEAVISFDDYRHIVVDRQKARDLLL